MIEKRTCLECGGVVNGQKNKKYCSKKCNSRASSKKCGKKKYQRLNAQKLADQLVILTLKLKEILK